MCLVFQRKGTYDFLFLFYHLVKQ
uniref:Uncharacterized protein n=1 Tax=Rhizophora mucronata TaxID=61149 RepID=A0A2P2QC52_RHIMU